MKPIEFIDVLRNSDKYIKTIFMEGGCFQFHLILKKIYPQAEIYMEIGHAVSKIDGIFYDITGIANGDFRKANKEDIKEMEHWSFCRSQELLIKECPFCEEPISV